MADDNIIYIEAEGKWIQMGIFVNPDNLAFQVALNSEIYVDKTGLLE